MAACDEGYRCEICGEPVTNLLESSLYVRYVLGEVPLHALFSAPERHLRCDLELARYIVHEKFTPPAQVGPLSNSPLPPEEQRQREQRVTAAWVRLREVVHARIPLTEYPLASEQKP
ncbi:MAG: hypothetical protein KDA76_00715 [Planctomycetaceae bacterium]|nr:hypothetical protein [Planctomycetaceae bacterium]